jgi:3-dehydroquinate synthase
LAQPIDYHVRLVNFISTMEVTIPVELPTSRYSVVIQPQGLQQLGEKCRQLKLGEKIIVVSNPVIFEHYGATVVESLKVAGFQVSTCLLPAGEQYKNFDSLQKIYDAAIDQHLERSSTLLALGGGVIGDMTGFAAASWLRGINFIQVPTSLLAMVDASIGGKTGINHPRGKNLIGAFYQPRLVMIDPEVLQTLPPREFRAGMAEVIKYGIIWDAELLDMLEKAQQLDSLAGLDTQLVSEILRRSAQAKVDVVSQDEKEAGLRAILNYGHTIGHAVESLTGYTVVNHGEAVAIGMVAAGKLAVAAQMWSQAETDRQDAVIQKTGLPTQLPAGMEIDQIVAALFLDKKVQAGRVRFVLPTKIGHATVTDTIANTLVADILTGM